MSIGWQPIAPTDSVDSVGTPLDYGPGDYPVPRGALTASPFHDGLAIYVTKRRDIWTSSDDS